MNIPSPTPAWRRFENITPGPEAASAAASCSFSLSTLEIATVPEFPNFALTERKHPEVWRWAIIGQQGFVLEEGLEATQQGAKDAASAAFDIVRSQNTV
ncbi:MAG TPA: hypothetical protein VII09_07850 [Opitutaceae bacterium]